ncbi:hypothetical protein BDN72DRAFT_840481 [Pluteus cervinus]|uniref:Uncharacterized protein n=1 Tax=Pluteus cervinus TaxID=181527 RepID=A0ACD3AVA8_9AGAR|nr:hypothetical protein BDN72DRAFT_840481 [Pluteus cervinus]
MARRSLALLAILSLSRLSVGAQIPLFSSPIATPAKAGPLIEVDAGRWNLSVGRSADSASHLVFDTVASLLQHWPNTHYRNGHNLVPGIIPVGTLMYHGRINQDIPNQPDWFATDPEHSRPFCILWKLPTCWHLTFVTTRPLRVLYFDGSSATKIQGGAMDAQDFVAWNTSRPDWVWEEEKRIIDLCDWGRKYQLDGFARMEMDFEFMLCDFASGSRLVSSIELEPGWDIFPTLQPPQAVGAPDPLPGRGPLARDFQTLQAGAWHNFYPGESRLKLDMTRLVSFYDTDMFPSLVKARSGVDRLQHRVAGLSKEDVQVMHGRLDEVLRDFDGTQSLDSGSGVDWRTLYQVIVDRYADRLEMLQYILNSTDPTAENYSQNYTQTLDSAMYRLQLMFTTYALRTAHPPAVDTGADNDLSWASPVYQYCATTHTSALYPSKSSFTKSEHLLFNALENTNREICRVLVGIWAEGVQAGVHPGLPFQQSDDHDGSVSRWLPMLGRWKNEVDGLMGWLGWSIWLKCRPACGMEEMCYMPTWPWFKMKPPAIYNEGDFGATGYDGDPDPEEEEWRNPLPRCIRRLQPFDWRF